MDLVDDAEVTYADPVAFFDREHGASRRTGILGEGDESPSGSAGASPCRRN